MDKQTILTLKLKEYRENNYLTQAELAEKLMVSDKTISKWENGETYPSKRNMLVISELLGISVETLLIERQEKTKKGLRIGRFIFDYLFLVLSISFTLFAFTTKNLTLLAPVLLCLIFGFHKID